MYAALYRRFGGRVALFAFYFELTRFYEFSMQSYTRMGIPIQDFEKKYTSNFDRNPIYLNNIRLPV